MTAGVNMSRALAVVLCLILAAAVPASAAYVGKSRSMAALSVRPETVKLTSAMLVAPSQQRAALINRTITALMICGAWAKFDVLYILAAHHEQAARLNWKNPGALTLSYQGGMSAADMTADRGSTGDGAAKYLDTGYDPSTASLGMALNDAHLGAVVLTSTSNGNFDAGAANNGLLVRMRSAADGTSAFRVNAAASTNISPNGTAPFHLAVVRRDAVNHIAFLNGVGQTPAAVASSSISNDLMIHKNSTSSFSNRQVAVLHAGRSLTDGEAACATNAFMRIYLPGVGAIAQ